jgi:hypothetical protein
MPDGATAFGRRLVDIHENLRDGIRRLRDEVAAGVDPGTALPARCLAFCTALERHHSAEDRETFPAVVRDRPELEPVVAQLTRDHELVAEMLGGVRALAGRLDAGETGRAAALAELDGLAALLESHFSYEERRLAALLDTLDAGPRE